MRRVFTAAITLLLSSVPAIAADGADLYTRCAACHLPTGEGVPGTYPPLADHIGHFGISPEGRAYLVAVITKGVMGKLEVNGESYRGMMPAQGHEFSDDDLAALLNYLMTTFPPQGKAKPFTTEEVASLKAQTAGLTPNAVLKVRPPLDEGNSK
ncbi:MAG: cytochrome c [Sphingomonadales bacterium]|nr:cytochrome c [Sphingomonadales bacterium]RIK93171.1 MAG: cytochrome C [Pseudomonadota bacterium]